MATRLRVLFGRNTQSLAALLFTLWGRPIPLVRYGVSLILAPLHHPSPHTCRDVCGYPQTVHGGLTAAIVDETLGGLGVCMWRSGALGFRPPAYTARLEVDYKKVRRGRRRACINKAWFCWVKALGVVVCDQYHIS